MMLLLRDPVQLLLALLAVAWAGSVAGVAVGSAGSPGGLFPALLAGTGVAILAGLLIVRGRARALAARREALLQARAMLRERLSDHLHVLLRAATAPSRTLDETERARLAEVVNAAREMESALELLTEATLDAWTARTPAPPPPHTS